MTSPAASRDRIDRWAAYLGRAGDGDQQAFAAFYDETSPIAYGLALRILGNAEDAGETVVDAYFQVWKHAAAFDPGRGTAVAWLTVLVRSRALDRLRARAARPRPPAEDYELDLLRDPAPNAEQSAESAQARERLRHALSSLLPEHRRLLTLAYFEGKSQSEIAAFCGAPLGTVKTRMRSALLQLRRLLSPPEEAAPVPNRRNF